jgi:hypothetical protein
MAMATATTAIVTKSLPPNSNYFSKSTRFNPAFFCFRYAKICCNLLDIPVHASSVQSLHVFFTLYTEFSANQHFIVGAADAVKAAMAASGDDDAKANVMLMDNGGGSQRMSLGGSGGGGGGGDDDENVWRADDEHSKYGKSRRDEGKDDD